MTDLETYLYSVAKGRMHSLFFADVSAPNLWEQKVTATATEKIAIVNVTVTFQTSRALEIGDPPAGGIDLCLSSGTSDALVTADTDKIVLFENLECASEIIPIYMDFSGCPVVGLRGQHMHLQGHTSTTAKQANAIVTYMVLPS